MPRLRGLSSEETEDLLGAKESSPSYGPLDCPECGQNRVFFFESFGGWECNGCKMIYSSKDLQVCEEVHIDSPEIQ